MKQLEGYKTYLFFALAVVLWLANQFGFAGFEFSPEQKEIFEVVVILGGIVLRKITKGAAAL